jgi:hypothetical protein
MDQSTHKAPSLVDAVSPIGEAHEMDVDLDKPQDFATIDSDAPITDVTESEADFDESSQAESKVTAEQKEDQSESDDES